MEGSFHRLSFGCAIAAILISTSPALAAFSRSAPDDADTVGYDSIVNELNREANRPLGNSRTKLNASSSGDAFDSIQLHAGVGVANLMEMISFDDGTHAFMGQRGLQVSAGIDLFSPNWMTEGTFRNFGETEDSAIRISMQEWELKVIYKDRLARALGFRAGGGLSARYLTVRAPKAAQIDFTTPSTVANLGLDYFLSDVLSIGADISGRTAMVTDTPDKNSVDITLRVDTHF